MVKIDIKNVVFGKYETFEGDPFFWMADFSTVYIRTLLQDGIATVIFWIYNIFILIFFIHMNKINSERDLVINDFAFIGMLLEGQIMYAGSIGTFPEFNRVFLTVSYLVRGNGERPDTSLNSEMIKTSKKLKFILLTVHLIIIPLAYCLSFARFTINTQLNLPQKFIISLVTKRPYLYDILYISFLILNVHTILYLKMPACLLSYISAHTTFVLKYLAKAMKNMQQTDGQFEDISECVNSDEYQKKVREDLVYLLKRHVEIKITVERINQSLKWRYFMFVLTIGVTIGCNLVMVMKINGNILGSLVVPLMLVYTAVLPVECGEQIRIQCDNVYNQAQQFAWYKWNKENCKLLVMLLYQTKTPVELKFHNITAMNRIALLSLYRISYRTVMLFNAI